MSSVFYEHDHFYFKLKSKKSLNYPENFLNPYLLLPITILSQLSLLLLNALWLKSCALLLFWLCLNSPKALSLISLILTKTWILTLRPISYWKDPSRENLFELHSTLLLFFSKPKQKKFHHWNVNKETCISTLGTQLFKNLLKFKFHNFLFPISS